MKHRACALTAYKELAHTLFKAANTTHGAVKGGKVAIVAFCAGLVVEPCIRHDFPAISA